jgi:hypothetical protein
MVSSEVSVITEIIDETGGEARQSGRRRVGDRGADSSCGVAGHGNTAPVYAIKDICSGRAVRGREGEVSLDSGARNGEYAANSRTLGLLHMRHVTDRGTKRYVQECITGQVSARVRDLAMARELDPAPGFGSARELP